VGPPVSGFLVLADISGYTDYLTGVELDHAVGVLNDLLGGLIESLGSPLQLVKVEGDAVFCHAPLDEADGADLVAQLEACYCAFADHRTDVVRSTTCECRACSHIADLDLKFIVHAGEYGRQQLGATEDLVGTAVIVVHRLSKNNVIDRTGVKAYVLISKEALAHVPPGLRTIAHEEDVAGIGRVACGVRDLAPIFAAHVEASKRRVVADEADIRHEFHLPIAPADAWSWFTDPDKRLRWQRDIKSLDSTPNDEGRIGVGAEFHCAHGALGGASLARYVDWQPYRSFTTTRTPTKRGPLAPPAMTETAEFADDGNGGTVVQVLLRCDDRRPGTIRRLHLTRPIINLMFERFDRTLMGLLQQSDAVRSPQQRDGVPDAR